MQPDYNTQPTNPAPPANGGTGLPQQPYAQPPVQAYGPQGNSPPQPVQANLYPQPGQAQPSQPPAGTVAAPQLAPKSNPNSTQNTLQIAEIRDGLVIMQDGSYRAVILAQSINFDLMSETEREGVELSYQGFLNSLYFPIQIMVRSIRVDLKTYMQKLDKLLQDQDNVLLSMLMEDYIGYVQYLTETSNIMDKQFYLVVPYFPAPELQQALQNAKKLGSVFNKRKEIITISEQDFVKAKTEVTQRVQSTLEAMVQMGVQAIPLNTQELIELYYNVYNPDTAIAQQLGNYQDLEADIITRGKLDTTPAPGGQQ